MFVYVRVLIKFYFIDWCHWKYKEFSCRIFLGNFFTTDCFISDATLTPLFKCKNYWTMVVVNYIDTLLYLKDGVMTNLIAVCTSRVLKCEVRMNWVFACSTARWLNMKWRTLKVLEPIYYILSLYRYGNIIFSLFLHHS